MKLMRCDTHKTFIYSVAFFTIEGERIGMNYNCGKKKQCDYPSMKWLFIYYAQFTANER